MCVEGKKGVRGAALGRVGLLGVRAMGPGGGGLEFEPCSAWERDEGEPHPLGREKGRKKQKRKGERGLGWNGPKEGGGRNGPAGRGKRKGDRADRKRKGVASSQLERKRGKRENKKKKTFPLLRKLNKSIENRIKA